MRGVSESLTLRSHSLVWSLARQSPSLFRQLARTWAGQRGGGSSLGKVGPWGWWGGRGGG